MGIDQTFNDDNQAQLRNLESEVKRLEKELQKAREKAQSSERLKSTFLANMSHAVRTPMNAIIGFSELIGIENISPSKKQEFIKIINEKGHQLLTLIDDIIEISKIESGKLELSYTQINIDEFLNEIFSATLQKKIKAGKELVELVLEKNSQEEFGLIKVDPGRLQQIINNILAFSMSNTSKGHIKFGYSIKDAKTIEFFIADTGIGLNKEDQKLLFDYFWEFEDITHQRIAENGLGLTIAKNLVEMLGGKITLNSELNKGNEFIFTIPIEKPGKVSRLSLLKEDKNISKSEKLEPIWKDKVILVVEDDLVNYQFIEALLEKTQVQLLHAENGNQALELCKTISTIDLILMDIKLPDKNGYEITREIKAIRSDIPIVAQTAFSVNEVREKCLASGCEDIISKPIEIELFLSTVNKYLA
jgi:CheY-like chemotaxis protein/nitrogen-specific signal transduction histidine kinase